MLAFTAASRGLLSQRSSSRRWAAVTVRGCVAVRSSKCCAAAASCPGLATTLAMLPGGSWSRVVGIAGEDHFTCLAEPDEDWQQGRVDDRWHAGIELGQAE